MHPRRHTLAITILTALVTTAVHAKSNDPQTLLIEQGHYWNVQKNPQRAGEVWHKVLSLNPDQADALYGLGSIGVQQNKPQQAQEYLARLQALSPPTRLALLLQQDIALAQPQNRQRLDEARRLADGDQRDKASEVFRQLFDGRPPQGTVGREYYNNLAFNPAGWPEARAGLERLLRDTPDDSILALFLAKHLVRHEASRAEGIRALATLTKRPDIAGDADESWRLALTWIDPPNAAQVPLFEAFLKAHPDDQDLRTQLNNGKQQAASRITGWQQDPTVARGLKALETGDQAAAEQAFQARLTAKPDDVDSLGGLGVVRQQQNKLAEAEQLLNRAVRQNGGSRWQVALNDVRYGSLLQQAREAQTQGLASKAQGLIAEAMRLDPARVDARLHALRSTQIASIAEQRGDLRGAQSALQDAVRSEPDDIWTRFALARLYLKTGEQQKARDLIDTLLKTHPENADALYTSALLSVETGEWKAAQATISRIRPAQRTPDMEALADDIVLNVQIKQAIEVAKRGQRQEARTLLDRVQPMASRSPERMATLASAYIDAGDPVRAQAIMRDVLAQTGAPSADLILQYADLLLRTGDDQQVSSILRDLQNQPMSAATRKRFDDVLYRYRIRQADHLRERGDLVAAYDTLAPALAQRPGDVAVVSALARMYTASGDSGKAFELYKPLLQRHPDDPLILLGAADTAMQARDYAFAEQALDQLLTLESGDPQTLTEAARIYQNMGKSGKAAALLSKAVAIEQSEKQRSLTFAPVAQAAAANVAPNPFAGLPGQRKQITSGDSSALIPNAYDNRQALAPMLASNATGNPFAAQAQATVTRDDDISPAQRALSAILQERSAYVTQGLSIRSNNSESGLSKLTDVETPLEINIPAGENRVAVRVTPVSLNAGSANTNSAQRFGGGTAASETGGSIGSQKDSGVGFAVAVERPDEGIKADIGTTPIGFKYSTAAGGVSVDRPVSDSSNLRYGLNVSRRPVTDSLTSFAGTTDQRTGQSWGGVTANGGRAQLSYDDQKTGAYGYGSWHKLAGTNVESNSRSELGAGVYGYLQNALDSKLTAGLSITGLSYANNQDYFTYGHGGYFSPQSYFALGVPVTWAQRTDRFSYQVKASVGVQHFQQDSADYFPNDKNLQSVSNERYAGQSKTGIGYSLNAAGEYKFGSNVFLGGNLGLDNASNYQQLTGGLYLRYMIENMTGPMDLPVSPYHSPYSN